MDRLPPETQEQLKKMSTARLMLKLGKAGYDDDRLEELEWAELLETLAETIIAQSETEQADLVWEAQDASKVPLPTEESSSIASEVGSEAVQLRELELEEKRAEREERRAEREDRRVMLVLEERKAAREAEMRKVALEAEAEARRLEVEEWRAEREARALEADRDAKMKLEQAKLAHEIWVLELKAQQTQLGEDAGDDGATPSEPRGEGSLALQTKRFGEMTRHVLPKMPAGSAELPQFFETVEKLRNVCCS